MITSAERYVVQSFCPHYAAVPAFRAFDEQTERPVDDGWFMGCEIPASFVTLAAAQELCDQLNREWERCR
jgi:hypothetical protein